MRIVFFVGSPVEDDEKEVSCTGYRIVSVYVKSQVSSINQLLCGSLSDICGKTKSVGK